MFWTSVVCGAGGAMGSMLVVVVVLTLTRLPAKNRQKEVTEASLEALQERNRLTQETHAWPERIAVAIERSN